MVATAPKCMCCVMARVFHLLRCCCQDKRTSRPSSSSLLKQLKYTLRADGHAGDHDGLEQTRLTRRSVSDTGYERTGWEQSYRHETSKASDGAGGQSTMIGVATVAAM